MAEPGAGTASAEAEGSRFVRLNRPEETDYQLRPRTLAEFVGQRRLVENLEVALEAARMRGEPAEHVLLSGSPGLGKTTLCHLIAAEMGADLVTTSGPALRLPKDLAGILCTLRAGNVLFIDEVHRIPAHVEEYLYGAMEDFVIDVPIDQGVGGSTVRVPLERFTLVAATTRQGLLSAPFRSRFGIREVLLPYPTEDLERILRRSASLLPVPIDDDTARGIAERSRGTPRIANRLLRRLRDLAQVRGHGAVDRHICEEGMERLGIDGSGLEETDRRLLGMLARAGGRPLGLKTLAAGLGESEDAIEEVYEPHLLRLELIRKTSRGREITERGRALIGAAALEFGEAPLFRKDEAR